MKDLIKNKCRICLKVFCCENCREKHEVNFHNVNLTCEICLNGKIYSKKVTGSLLNHIKDKHLPLSCVFCKKMFENASEIEFYSKCIRITSNRLEMNPITPIYRQSPSKIQTPYQKSIIMASNAYFAITSTTVHPTTSTPLQNIRSESDILEKISTDLTPLDNRERENANTSRITPVTTDEPKKIEELKRKVTFCDTPNVEYQKNRQGAFTKDLVKYLIVEEDCQSSAPIENCGQETETSKNNTNEIISQNLDNDKNSELIQDDKYIEQTSKSDDNGQRNDMKNDESVWTSAFVDSSNLASFKSCDENVASRNSEDKNYTHQNIKENTDSGQFSHNSSKFHTPLSKPELFDKSQNKAQSRCETPTVAINNCNKSKYPTLPERDENDDNKTCNFCTNNTPSEINSNEPSSSKENGKFGIQKTNNYENEFRTPLCEINCCLIVEESCFKQNSTDSVNIIKENIDLQYTPKLKEIKCSKCILNSTHLIEANINEIKLRKPIAQSSIIQYCLQTTEKAEICESKFTASSISEDSSGTESRTNSIWSSMTNLVKTVFHGFTSHGETETKKLNPLKRSFSEDDTFSIEQGPYLKRMKLTDIRCRPTIRNLKPEYRMNSFTRVKETADKATQTDESLFD